MLTKFITLWLVLLCFVTSCKSDPNCPSENVTLAFEPPLRTCHNSSLHISFDITNAQECDHNVYSIEIYHFGEQQTIPKSEIEEFFNMTDSGVCHVSLLLSEVTIERYHLSILHIRLYLTLYQCSENFTVYVDNDPPDPVPSLNVTVYPTGVIVFNWSAPHSPLGCPLLNYTVYISNDGGTITINDTTYTSTDLMFDKDYTVSVVAINGAGISNVTSMEFITALEPSVTDVNYTVELIPSPIRAQFNATAQIKNINNPFSFPSQLNLTVSCYNGGSPNSTVYNISHVNGSMEYNLSLPVDLTNCTALLTWSNRYSFISNTFTQFNTTQLLSIQVHSVSNGLTYYCYYRQYSTLWGCGIKATLTGNISTSNSSSNNTVGYLTDLCLGNYTVTSYYITSDNTSHVIDHVTMYIRGQQCGNSNNSILSLTAIVLIAGFGSLAIIVIILIVIVAVAVKCYHKSNNKTDSASLASPHGSEPRSQHRQSSVEGRYVHCFNTDTLTESHNINGKVTQQQPMDQLNKQEESIEMSSNKSGRGTSDVTIVNKVADDIDVSKDKASKDKASPNTETEEFIQKSVQNPSLNPSAKNSLGRRLSQIIVKPNDSPTKEGEDHDPLLNVPAKGDQKTEDNH